MKRRRVSLKIELNREPGAAPLYYQIETILRQQIEDGEPAKGELFYTEKQLQEMFDVSRITVRQAIGSLVNNGYLKRSRGVGTTVVFDKIDETLKRVISFSEEMKLHGITMVTRHCKVALTEPPRAVARELRLAPHEQACWLERVRCAGEHGGPVVYSVTYLRNDRSLSLDAQDYQQSLYRLLEERYGITIVRGRDVLEAVAATRAVADFLGVSEGAPVFKRTRRTFDRAGDPVEYSVCYYPGDKYKYSVEL
ncbi:MAG TPA: GntR family transcriptional regulator [Candidatus Gallacutalibacter stercoravium]|nr:GntR family transcriptional regulator [Candidatus Gallacutalibacter stercoravium]